MGKQSSLVFAPRADVKQEAASDEHIGENLIQHTGFDIPTSFFFFSLCFFPAADTSNVGHVTRDVLNQSSLDTGRATGGDGDAAASTADPRPEQRPPAPKGGGRGAGGRGGLVLF